MRHILGAVVATMTLAATGVSGASAPSATLNLLGEVYAGASPIESATVVSFGLSSYNATQTLTDSAGSFQFPPLPAGVYRVIAVKSGFAPAIATVVPSDRSLALKLRLTRGKASAETRDQIWEIRRSLPSDVLREIDLAMGFETIDEPVSEGRFGGVMRSVTTFDSSGETQALAQTDLALSGAFPAGVRLEVSGRHAEGASAYDDSQEVRASGVQLMLSTEGDSMVRLASSRNLLLGTSEHGDAGLQTHQFEWSRPGTEIAVRYVEQDNALPSAFSSGMVEVRGEQQIWGSERSDVGVGVRLIQETSAPVGAVGSAGVRLADLSTSAAQRFGDDRLELRYGLRARVGADALDSWIPETSARIRLGANMALLLSGQMKLVESHDGWIIWPAIVRYEDIASSAAAPSYRYAVGFVTGEDSHSQFSTVLSVTAIDDPVTIIFDDMAAADVWDAYVLEKGDRHEDVELRYQTRLASDRLAIDMQSTVARTTGVVPSNELRGYLLSRVRSLYVPSGTSVDIAYRRVAGDEEIHRTAFNLSGERLNVRMGQDLHLPLDLTLLFGVDLSRELPSTGADGTDLLQHRYVGGVAFAF